MALIAPPSLVIPRVSSWRHEQFKVSGTRDHRWQLILYMHILHRIYILMSSGMWDTVEWKSFFFSLLAMMLTHRVVGYV